MPTNRTAVARGRRWRISPAAVQRWREIRPLGISVGTMACGSGFDDEILARCFGEGVLIAQGHEAMVELRDALEAAVQRGEPPDAA